MMNAVLEASERGTHHAEKQAPMTESPDFHHFPAYFQERQRAAWERFQSLPMPARTDQAWRFADVKALDLAPYRVAEPVGDAGRAALLKRSRGVTDSSGRMVFANDRLLAHEVQAEELSRKGVAWLPLEQALVEQRELIERHFMRENNVLGSAKFAALHEARVKAGSFLHVPRGVEIALPIEVFHWLAGDAGAIFPHTLIIADECSKVTVVDTFTGESGGPGFVCGVNDIIVGSGAQVTYAAIQRWNEKTLAFHLNNTSVGRDATALALRLNLGGARVRDEAVSHLRGPGGRSDMLSVSAADRDQVFDQRTLQIHEQPNTASDLLYKNALNDRARTIFTGLIRVDPGAQKTDAYQKVRNLILSEDAEANSAPGLEIKADDVRCTHGATSGTLAEDEMFYLQSRGIPRAYARQLITFGFLSEVFDRIPCGTMREYLTRALHGKIA